MDLKQPPCAIEAELCVLAALMTDERCAWDVFAAVSAIDFYRQEHQEWFRVLHALHQDRKPMDFLSLTEELRRRGMASDQTFSILGSIAAESWGNANAVGYAQKIREKSQARALIALAFDVADKAYTDAPAELVSFMSQRLVATNVASLSKAKKFTEVYEETESAILEIRSRRESGQLIGAPTGLKPLDDRLGGLVGPKLIIIAARPATGKTALLNLAGVNAARHGYGGIIESLEMSEDALMIRALAAEAGCNVTKLSLGFSEEFNQGAAAYSSIGDIPLWIDTDTYDLDAICAQIAMHRHRYGIQWAAVDHIGLVQTKQRFGSRNDQMGHISRTLKQLAKRLNIPVIALSQLSRDCEKEGRRPQMSDLRDSGNLEQDADVVMFLHTPYDKRNEARKPVEIGLLKNRGGRTGWIDGFVFEGATQRITYEHKHDVTPFNPQYPGWNDESRTH
ncbi:replicative DNA helicase [Hydrocarboniphaga effusa]|uniref:replicative DNA helicase n=1 Tax=Hydrocarboniphaga effusa TaxID=243629 RepID=UPI00398BE50E